jgi:hypothetical protein
MGLTKEVLQTYRNALQQEYNETVNKLNMMGGAISATDRFLRYVELEAEGAEAVKLEEILGYVRKP